MYFELRCSSQPVRTLFRDCGSFCLEPIRGVRPTDWDIDEPLGVKQTWSSWDVDEWVAICFHALLRHHGECIALTKYRKTEGVA